MVKSTRLIDFYIDFVDELGISTLPIVSKKCLPLSFENVVTHMASEIQQGASQCKGVIFPCVRNTNRSFDKLQNGKETSLQFILLFGFSNEQDEECKRLCYKGYGEGIKLMKQEIEPAEGFAFSCIAYDTINTNGIWLGRVLRCDQIDSNRKYSFVSFSLEQMMMDRLCCTDIWSIHPFCSTPFANISNSYFIDQFRKNGYFNGYNEERYIPFLPTVLPINMFYESD